MNEAEYLMKNYGDRGGCYPSRPSAKVDNTLRDRRGKEIKLKPVYNVRCYYSFKIIHSLKTLRNWLLRTR